MQPRAACRSREHSYLVAFHDGCCDNDDRLVATYRSHALGNICLHGNISGSHDVARCSRGRVTWSRFATGAMTIMMQRPRALRSHTSGYYPNI